LSFAAVTGLVAAYEAIQSSRFSMRSSRRSSYVGRFFVYGGGIALSTIIAGAATAPFVAYHFNHLATYGNIANLLAVPITALWIMPWGVFSMVLMPLGLEQIGLIPMGWGIDAVVAIAKTAANFPGSVQIIPAFSTQALVMMTFGALWLCLWRHKIRMIGITGICAGLYMAVITNQPILLAHNSGQLFAYQKASSISMLGPGTRSNRFAREVWTERAGHRNQSGSNAPATHIQEKSCDLLGCIIKKNNKIIALVWNEGALIEDCWVADIIISSVPVRGNCPNPEHVIDRFDLWKEGSHAIFIKDHKFNVLSTKDVRGVRPWTNDPFSGNSSIIRSTRKPIADVAS
jgi:competence protein ComEC